MRGLMILLCIGLAFTISGCDTEDSAAKKKYGGLAELLGDSSQDLLDEAAANGEVAVDAQTENGLTSDANLRDVLGDEMPPTPEDIIQTLENKKKQLAQQDSEG